MACGRPPASKQPRYHQSCHADSVGVLCCTNAQTIRYVSNILKYQYLKVSDLHNFICKTFTNPTSSTTLHDSTRSVVHGRLSRGHHEPLPGCSCICPDQCVPQKTPQDGYIKPGKAMDAQVYLVKCYCFLQNQQMFDT